MVSDDDVILTEMKNISRRSVINKTSHPFSKKNIKKLAKRQSLVLVKAEFYPHLYPGYKIKRGDGLKCDESFPQSYFVETSFSLGRE